MVGRRPHAWSRSIDLLFEPSCYRVYSGPRICAIVSGCSAAVDRVAIEDAQTAARVKTALVNDPELGASAIEVRVERRIVRLAGRVRTQTDADRAAAVARSVPGVQDVELALQVGVEAPTELPDARARSRSAPTDNVPEIEGIRICSRWVCRSA